MTTQRILVPADMLEKLLDIAARSTGVNDTPTLMMFAEVRRLIEEAKLRP